MSRCYRHGCRHANADRSPSPRRIQGNIAQHSARSTHTANLSMRLMNEILHQPCNVHCNGRYDSKPFHAATASFKVHFCFNWVKYKQPFARFAVSKNSRSKLVETTQDDCGLGRANVWLRAASRELEYVLLPRNRLTCLQAPRAPRDVQQVSLKESSHVQQSIGKPSSNTPSTT